MIDLAFVNFQEMETACKLNTIVNAAKDMRAEVDESAKQIDMKLDNAVNEMRASV